MHKNDRILAVILAVVGAAGIWYLSNSAPIGTRDMPLADPKSPKLGPSWVGATANYQVTSWATVEQTTQVGSTAEALLRAYLAFFKLDNAAVPKGGLKLSLYRNREQFKQRHPQPAWAEALYSKGVSYAYYDASGPNAFHWMLHEATHQLNEQVGHTPPDKWINEGLASYFGASKLEDYNLTPGKIEAQAYPVWWLGKLRPTGDMRKDFASGRVVPLRALVGNSGGPALDSHVNQWYLGYWSLTQFLLHGAGGKYAAGYHKLLAGKSATLADFEREIGPVDAVQAEWYHYLQTLELDGQDTADEGTDNVTVVQ
jgi:hypothetical protein